MNYTKLANIKKAYFGYEEISRALGISQASARVSAARFVKYGFLVRIKRNIYMLQERWRALGEEERFAAANLIEVPSYISLLTALSYYQVTTLIQRDFIESISVKRTKAPVVEGVTFNYTRMDKALYFGFVRSGGFFIATPEKALIDAVYLLSLKRYSFDMTSIDGGKLKRNEIEKFAGKFPDKTRYLLGQYGYIKKA